MYRIFRSSHYNHIFNTKTGDFARWGKTIDDNPPMSKFGMELLDIEVSTVCSKACSWCYKSNNHRGRNMSLDIFKKVLDKMPSVVLQVALGIGDIDANPDLWGIMEYCRKLNVVPNITINGERMTKEYYDKLASLCGAVAVSLYDKDVCYQAVKELTDRGVQTNIHCLLATETLPIATQTLLDQRGDPRLGELNAVVFLALKKKGIRNHFNTVSMPEFKGLVELALSLESRFGFDSCSAPYFLTAVEGRADYKRLETMCEPCESTLFSYYVNVDGLGFPCSFLEGVQPYTGIDIVNTDFADIWQGEQTVGFRGRLLSQERRCPIYHIIKEKEKENESKNRICIQ